MAGLHGAGAASNPGRGWRKGSSSDGGSAGASTERSPVPGRVPRLAGEATGEAAPRGAASPTAGAASTGRLRAGDGTRWTEVFDGLLRQPAVSWRGNAGSAAG